MNVLIRRGNHDDRDGIYSVYKSISVIPDGIIRFQEEVDIHYIEDFIAASLEEGLILVAEENNLIIGEIHAYPYKLKALRHNFTNLTIAVHPESQGKGVGKKLFNTFLEIVREEFKHILRIELFTREHNEYNVRFYESLGFINEGRQDSKILNQEDQLETPIHMAWFNPDFKKDWNKKSL